MSNLWKITENTLCKDEESIMRKGNVFQIANGYMGYRGTLDEYRKDQQVGITLAGIFDKVGENWREPVNAPNGAFTQVSVNGTALHILRSEVKQHSQSIDLSHAVFSRETTFLQDGIEITIRSERFLSIADPNLMVVRYSVSASDDCDLTLTTGIDYDIWNLSGEHLIDFKTGSEVAACIVSARTQELSKHLSVCEIIDHSFGEETRVDDPVFLGRKIHGRAESGKTYSFNKYIAVVKDGDQIDAEVQEAAFTIARKAKAIGYDKCKSEHVKEWDKRWKQCDVTIEGDDEAQLGLRYSIFQLLMVAPVEGSAGSIPARALSGQVYKGAIFWDTEMFMFPFFLHTYPEVAKELLQYRINTLEGARRKAKTEGIGYKGAFYAWESQETGDESCTYFNIGDPFTNRDLRTYFRDKQIHISGDIALAMWEYCRITGDDQILLNGGAEVILECARFYDSFAYFKRDRNQYELLDVVGPDEYHERVNNNAFTNQIAKGTFEVALKTVEYLETHAPDKLRILDDKIGILKEIPQFREILEKLYIPEPDTETGVIEQFDGYFRLEDSTLEEVKGRVIHPNEYLGTSQGVAAHTQIIKQADVVMMLNLFKEHFSERIKRANWEYYEPRTEHGSSLSACAYAMVAADIGKTDWAYRYFLKTAKLDLEANYKVYVGTTFMGGSHPAANGGAWMSLIFGFCGLRTMDNKVMLNPRLVDKWRSVAFKIHYKGSGFLITVTQNNIVISSNIENIESVHFEIHGHSILINPGNEHSLSY